MGKEKEASERERCIFVRKVVEMNRNSTQLLELLAKLNCRFINFFNHKS
jgi:hypothetical protein